MKTLPKLTYSFILFFSLAPVFADIPDGHWESQKLDHVRNLLITYENWFEEDAVEGRVFKQKVLKEEKLDATPAPVVPPTVKTGKTWFCYAHDFIDGHNQADPSDESCVSRFYKGSADSCKEDAIESALKVCRGQSTNRPTCTIDWQSNCFTKDEIYQ